MDIEEYINELPDDTYGIYVANLGLTYIPDLTRFTHLKELKCENNELTTLPPLPDSLGKIFCYRNKITVLPKLPNRLWYLDCDYNFITNIPQPLPPNLQKLYCSENLLTFLPNLHKNIRVERFFYNDNPIENVYRRETVCWNREFLHVKIRIINRFRFIYYSMKFKQRFRDWLWVKVREPKIRQKYCPTNLVELICGVEDETEFHNVLDGW
jgi:hypothetical protein